MNMMKKNYNKKKEKKNTLKAHKIIQEMKENENEKNKKKNQNTN